MTNYIWTNSRLASRISKLSFLLLALLTAVSTSLPSTVFAATEKAVKSQTTVSPGNVPQSHALDADPQATIQEATNKIQQNPSDATAYNDRGAAYNRLEQYDQAMSDLNEAIKIDPNNADAYVNRGYTYFNLKNYPQALQDCNEAIRINPNLASAYVCRSGVYSKLEQYQQAQADTNKALSLQHNDEGGLLDRCRDKYLMKDYRGAAADASAAIARDPKNPVAWDNRGIAEHRLKEFSAALRDYDKAISLNPNEAKYYCHKGITLNEMGRLDEAIENFDKAISLKPDYALAFFDRAVAEFLKKEYEKAAKDIQEAIHYDPHYALAIYELPLIPIKGGDQHQITQPEEYYYRACTYILMIRNRPALDDLKKYIDMTAWKGELAQSAVILSYLGYVRNHQMDQGQAMLGEASTNVDTSQWPYPVIRYLKKEISTDELLSQATDPDKQTDAHAYIGINMMLTSGDHPDAVQQMEWAKQQGDPKLVSYSLAVKEIERIQFAHHLDTERN